MKGILFGILILCATSSVASAILSPDSISRDRNYFAISFNTDLHPAPRLDESGSENIQLYPTVALGGSIGFNFPLNFGSGRRLVQNYTELTFGGVPWLYKLEMTKEEFMLDEPVKSLSFSSSSAMVGFYNHVYFYKRRNISSYVRNGIGLGICNTFGFSDEVVFFKEGSTESDARFLIEGDRLDNVSDIHLSVSRGWVFPKSENFLLYMDMVFDVSVSDQIEYRYSVESNTEVRKGTFTPRNWYIGFQIGMAGFFKRRGFRYGFLLPQDGWIHPRDGNPDK